MAIEELVRIITGTFTFPFPSLATKADTLRFSLPHLHETPGALLLDEQLLRLFLTCDRLHFLHMGDSA